MLTSLMAAWASLPSSLPDVAVDEVSGQCPSCPPSTFSSDYKVRGKRARQRSAEVDPVAMFSDVRLTFNIR